MKSQTYPHAIINHSNLSWQTPVSEFDDSMEFATQFDSHDGLDSRSFLIPCEHVSRPDGSHRNQPLPDDEGLGRARRLPTLLQSGSHDLSMYLVMTFMTL